MNTSYRGPSAARAVGASEGFLYIRAEYPLAVKRIDEAIEKCVDAGLLGNDILGSGFSLSLRLSPRHINKLPGTLFETHVTTP